MATAAKLLSNPTVYYLETGSPQRSQEEMLTALSSLSVKMMLKLLQDLDSSTRYTHVRPKMILAMSLLSGQELKLISETLLSMDSLTAMEIKTHMIISCP